MSILFHYCFSLCHKVRVLNMLGLWSRSSEDVFIIHQHRFIIHIWWLVSGPEQEDKPGQCNLTCLLLTSFFRCRKHMRKHYLISNWFSWSLSSRATNSQVKLINWYVLICIFFPHVKYWGRGILSVSWNKKLTATLEMLKTSIFRPQFSVEMRDRKPERLECSLKSIQETAK